MCLVPAIAQPGDYVAILSGYRMPMCLRRVSTPPKQHYELLGQCYIHDMMQSLAWDLIGEHKCKYQEGSEDRLQDTSSAKSLSGPDSYAAHTAADQRTCDGGSATGDHNQLLEVLGKRLIVLV